MTFRHGAALALVGWYLMMPPDAKNSGTQIDAKRWRRSYEKDPKAALRKLYDVKAPLSRWTILQTFETEEQCNGLRSQGSRAAPMLTTIQQSKCVASDDRRLKRK